MSKASDAPQLAPASGSLFQFVLSTTPLLAVYIYFIYLAAKRPSLPYYQLPEGLDDDTYIKEVIQAEGPQIRLTEMLYVFLTTMVLWVTLGIYATIFVPKRRKLMNLYADRGYTVTGNVRFDDITRKGLLCRCYRSFFRSDYAYVNYALPNQEEYNEKRGGEPRRWMVQKRIRTYQMFSRERVPVVVLPDLPMSGQAKTDVQIDISTYRENAEPRNRMTGVLLIVILWIAFTFFGSLYLIVQIGKIDEKDWDENVDWAWLVFGLTCVLILPVVAYGGNLFRWLRYKNWLLKSGKIVPYEMDVPFSESSEIIDERMCGNICGSGGDDDVSTSPYRTMV